MISNWKKRVELKIKKNCKGRTGDLGIGFVSVERRKGNETKKTKQKKKQLNVCSVAASPDRWQSKRFRFLFFQFLPSAATTVAPVAPPTIPSCRSIFFCGFFRLNFGQCGNAATWIELNFKKLNFEINPRVCQILDGLC